MLSVFVKFQVDTINLKAQCDSIFLDATYDMLSAYELNSNNNKYSTVSDSLIRDIEASINSFTTTFGNSTKMFGTSKKSVMEFIPAILFTLHDGYYIYTPTQNENGEYVHKLKPYIYYTKEYVSGNKKLIINYSLDNYIAVYFYDVDEKEYQSRAGFVEPIANSLNESKDGGGIYINGEKIYYNGKEIVKNEELHKNTCENISDTDYYIINETYTLSDAYDYCVKAYSLTKWFNEIIDSEFTWYDTTEITPKKNYKAILKITKENQALPQSESAFNEEKRSVIKETIESNLIQSMELYKKKSGIDFKMPQFTVMDLETVVQNICAITFIQGMPIGTSTYNNYLILPSTENSFYVNEKNLYYIGYGEGADECYHRLGCEHLKGEVITRL